MTTVSDVLRLCFHSHGDSVLQKMNVLRDEHRFCDVTLILQGAPKLRFPGHRVVLAASSSFLRDQFLLRLQDGEEELELGAEVVPNSEVGRRLLLSCYTGVLEVPLRELVGYLTAASALQMSQVVERCAQAVSQYLNPTLANLKQEVSSETATPQPDSVRPMDESLGLGYGKGEAGGPGGFQQCLSEDTEYSLQQVHTNNPAPYPIGANRRKQRPPTPCRLKDYRTLSPPESPTHTSGLADSSQGEDQEEGPGEEEYMLAGHMQGGGASPDESYLNLGAGLMGADLGTGPMLGHLSERAYLCRRCDQVFQHLDSYVRHLREHRQYLCLLCGRSFSQKSNLTRHVRVHTGVKPFQCPLCHKTFSQKATLQDHLNLHTGDKPHKCNYCAVHFAHKPGLRRHLKDIHGKSSLQNIFEELVD
ncbi:zinc finger and BTB domain-containing protein 26-like [Osmerus eperlanus]|uniref:zinc finger and BTB domain-containing protein 26-like n=1 Tax=Osmerus eperlanus TaxID=29151 RepID=UPI002E0F0E54